MAQRTRDSTNDADTRDLIRQRLSNQWLTDDGPIDRTPIDQILSRTPADIVSRLGAVQAQDYPAAKWALGLRAGNLTEVDVDRAFNDGAILRTHVLRPTWHFVMPADIRWMLALTAPRINAMSAYYYRQQELDDKTFTKSRKVLERTLRDGKHLTRIEISTALTRAGIACGNMRLIHLLAHAELDRVICSGPRRGKQFTYALLDDRAPAVKPLTRDESLAELTRRYFTSHGPATVKDYSWWSGLTVRDAKAGIALVKPALLHETIAGCEYWFVDGASSAPASAAAARPARATAAAHLLPNYDEYLIAYKDRDTVVSASSAERSAADWQGPTPFRHHVIADGRLAGSWRLTLERDAALVDVTPYEPFTRTNTRALAAAADRYSRFLDLPVKLSIARQPIRGGSRSASS